MKKYLALLALMGLLAGCGATSQPTELPPSQTPWIVIVTSTAGEAPGTQLPASTPTAQSKAATPTRLAQAAATKAPSAAATSTSGETGESPTAAVESTGTPALAARTSTPTSATSTPAVGEMKYPPPVLLEPPNNRPVSWRSTVLLQWSAVGDGELQEDEYYHLHLERRPQPDNEEWYGDYVYTKETEYRAEGPFLAPFHPSSQHGPGVVYWWVRVVRRTGQDENGKPIGIDISPYSEERTLIVEPKP